MKFDNNTLQYRIALNTNTQIFMAYDAKDPKKIAYGITIEQAKKELNKSI